MQSDASQLCRCMHLLGRGRQAFTSDFGKDTGGSPQTGRREGAPLSVLLVSEKDIFTVAVALQKRTLSMPSCVFFDRGRRARSRSGRQ